MGSPSDAIEFRHLHPFDEHPKHTYFQICKKIRQRYGIEDADRWFQLERKRISDKCLPDPYALCQSRSLQEFWEKRQMEARFRDLQQNSSYETVEPGKHSVELYNVRGPGSNGEIGVLTTSHDLDEFTSHLAIAAAKLIRNGKPEEIEHSIRWILRNSLPVAFKLAGYKADQVVERHTLMCGSAAPAADDIVATS